MRERRRTVSRRAAGTGTNLLSNPGVAKPGAKRGLTSKGAKIYDLEGREVNFHGIAWFGFNNLQTMVGLGHGPDNMSRDFKTIVWRMKMLGFNAVRYASHPISIRCLHYIDLMDIDIWTLVKALKGTLLGSTPGSRTALQVPSADKQVPS